MSFGSPGWQQRLKEFKEAVIRRDYSDWEKTMELLEKRRIKEEEEEKQMSDLIKRLRVLSGHAYGISDIDAGETMLEAIDELEAKDRRIEEVEDERNSLLSALSCIQGILNQNKLTPAAKLFSIQTQLTVLSILGEVND